MKKLVRVEMAFDLLAKGDTYEADVESGRTKTLLELGYLGVVEGPEFLIQQNESEIEGASAAGDSAPRSKRSGKVPAKSGSDSSAS